MKVTAILPDEMIRDIKDFTGGKNTTDSLIKALRDWLYLKRLEKLNKQVADRPLQFSDDFTHEKVRKLSNRQHGNS
ncbi:MAG: DUF2191 domain-containing protein [Bacteroidota bacterium]